jgi:citrate synthase
MAPIAIFDSETSDVAVKSQSLSVTDNRTGKHYTIPIEHNAVKALDFKKIATEAADPDYPADQSEHGLRLYDPGFYNTAVVESKVTYVLVLQS